MLTTQSLSALVDASGLKSVQVGGNSLAIPFRGEHAENLVVQARELTEGHVAFFAVSLPSPGWLGEEAALRNLMRVSFLANYTKALKLGEDTIGLAVELPLDWLTPQTTEGVVRGLIQLADIRKGDMPRWDIWQQRLVQSGLSQAQSIQLDPAQSAALTEQYATAAGFAVTRTDSGAQLVEVKIADVPLKVVAKHQPFVSSFIVSFGDIKPKGSKKKFLQNLLGLNQRINVARTGLDSDSDVAILFETPVIAPDLFDRLVATLGITLVGLTTV